MNCKFFRFASLKKFGTNTLIAQSSASSSATQAQQQEKGKGRDHSHLNGKSKSKHSTHETLNSVSSALSAKVKCTLADPLLPGQHKRTIVLTTSKSEYEHSDDDGSWSSEEMGSEDEEVGFLFCVIIIFQIIYIWNLISPPFYYYRKGGGRIGRGRIGSWYSNSSNLFSNLLNVHLLCGVHIHRINPIRLTAMLMQSTVRNAIRPLVATVNPLITPKVRH